MTGDYDEIVPNLFLGNAASYKLANKPPAVKCCLTFGVRDSGAPRWAAEYCFCELEDRAAVAPEQALAQFERGYHFIERNIAKGVLVHCGLGVSRSAACVCYYLMRTKGLKYEDALAYTRARRQCVKPNEGFEKSLRSCDYYVSEGTFYSE